MYKSFPMFSYTLVNNLFDLKKFNECNFPFVSYINPYDAMPQLNIYIPNNLNFCLSKHNKIIEILPTQLICNKWAIACIEHILPIFEDIHDKNPRNYIQILKNSLKNFNKISIMEVYNKTKYEQIKHLSRKSTVLYQAINDSANTFLNISFSSHHDSSSPIFLAYSSSRMLAMNKNLPCMYYEKINKIIEIKEVEWQKNSLLKIIKSSSKFYKKYLKDTLKILCYILPHDLNFIIIDLL